MKWRQPLRCRRAARSSHAARSAGWGRRLRPPSERRFAGLERSLAPGFALMLRRAERGPDSPASWPALQPVLPSAAFIFPTRPLASQCEPLLICSIRLAELLAVCAIKRVPRWEDVTAGATNLRVIGNRALVASWASLVLQGMLLLPEKALKEWQNGRMAKVGKGL